VCTKKKQYSGAKHQNIANNFSLVWCKSMSPCCAGDILSEEGNVRRLKGRTLEDLEDVLVIWMEQVNV
jgi:hypothetical protein